ncbi:MAG TPA: DUF2277 domain-containing protein [Candidatus Saccharimonadales bacterium]|nr:DUF2277 domain-containing protein [Candidatus Saccharimonadales bacterium]
MCRNIKPLFNYDPPATNQEIHDAALQFVRKVSGFQKPSEVNEATFNESIEAISEIVRNLVDSLKTSAEPITEKRRHEKRTSEP